MLKELWMYKVLLPDGQVLYEMKDDPLHSGSAGADTLSTLADFIRAESGLAIHFQLPFGLEMPEGLAPRLCLPLNQKEIQEIFMTLSSRK